MSNLLGTIRLSDLSDETTSPARQRSKIQQYADLGDHKVVAWAEDLDVSGAVSPFLRAELGPWLCDPVKIGQWDVLIVARLDRLSRSVRDFLELVEWLTEHGKKVVCLDPSIDLTSPWGEFMATMLVALAQFERSITARRVAESVKALSEAGQYSGGVYPFGLLPVKLEPKGWGFIPDPEYGPVVQEMAARFLGGESLHMISRWMNENKTPTSRNVLRIRQGKAARPSKWQPNVVKRVLSSPAIVGVMVKEDGVLHGADGMPVRRCDPLVSDEDYAAIQERLAANADKTGARVNSSPWSQVVFCGACGSAMHSNTCAAGKYSYTYLECSAARAQNGVCTEKKIRAELVEEMLEQAVLDQVGGDLTRTKTTTPANDTGKEVAEVNEAISAWEARAVAGESADSVLRIISGLEARKAKLIGSARPAVVRWEDGTETVAERWAQEEGRNAWLRSANLKLYVQHHDIGMDPDLAFEHDVMGVPEVQAAEMPDGEHVTTTRLYKNGVTGKLYLGDLQRAALRAA